MGDLTENKLFESEVRFHIPNIEAFQQRVATLGLILIREYAFTDQYFKPKQGEWNSVEQSLRIRSWRRPARSPVIYLTKQEVRSVGKFSFKRSLYPEGKRVLYTGELSDCQDVVKDLGFIEAYTIIKKQGYVWQDKAKQLEFCAEETDIFGWSGEMEVEGENFELIEEKIRQLQEKLGLADEQLTYKPVAVMIEEKLYGKI